jgi:hypothetical protein
MESSGNQMVGASRRRFSFSCWSEATRKSMEQNIAEKRIAQYLLALVLAAASAAGGAAEQPTYDLDVAFDVPRARIVGTATIDVTPGTELSISPGRLSILSLTNAGQPVAPDLRDADPFILLAEGPVRIHYEGTFRAPEGDVIDHEKISLADVWYPVVEGTFRYRFTATLPADFVAISEGDAVRRTESGGLATYSFDFPYPQRDWDGIAFVASSQWVSRYARYRDIELSAHVYSRNAERLDEIVKHAQRYLEQHEGRLGTYPFKRLAIVEDPLPVTYSYSRATYVVLSQRSVASIGSAAPEDSSLNHEIAHEWFGDAIVTDYDGGNWAEGFASYFADHLENERLGRAWERRQRMMNAYQNNVTDEVVSPLSGFSELDDRVSRFIGYAKSALVVHMLRRLLGDERFVAATRNFVAENEFRAASWADIRRTFERAAGTDLGWFFEQWVDGTAMPELGLEGISVAPEGGQHELRFTVTQKQPELRLTVPATVYFEQERSERVTLQVFRERNDFRFLLNDRPVRVVLDEDYDVFRRLTPAEVPPTIDTLLTRKRVNLLVPPGEEEKFQALIEAFEREGPPMALYGWVHEERPRKGSPAAIATRFRPPPWAPPGARDVRPELRGEHAAAAVEQTSGISLILFGRDHPLIVPLVGSVKLPEAGFTVTVLKHPRSPGDVVAIFTASSKAEVDAAYSELVNHPRYSSAAFDAGKLIWRELRQGQRGISAVIAAEQR